MAHRRGERREQSALMLDELVAEALVRVIDAWDNSLNLLALGFGKVRAQVLGAPRECHRNVECMAARSTGSRPQDDCRVQAHQQRSACGELRGLRAVFYRCPADKMLLRKQVMKADNAVIYTAQAHDCGSCEHKAGCTTAPRRFVMRHLCEEALQANAQREAGRPQMMRLRRQTVEHPFADIKHRILGNARLFMRGLSGARSELGLAVLAYNLKRVFMKGGACMRQAIGA